MKNLFIFIAALSLATIVNAQAILSGGGNFLVSATGPTAKPFSNSVNTTLPTLPLATGAMVMQICHSFCGFGNAVDSQTTGHASDNFDYADGLNFVFALDPRVNIMTYYDSSTQNNYQLLNGSNYGYPGDHLQPAGAVPGCMSRWTAGMLNNAQIVIDDCVLNTINSSDIGAPPITNVPGLTAYIENEILKHIAQAALYGKWIIEPELTPNNYWGTGDGRFTILANINTFINGLTQPNVKIWPRYTATSNVDATQNVNMFNCDGSTTLSSAITTTGQTAITVVSGTAPSMPTTGTFAILVGLGSGTTEQMQVTAGAGTTSWIVTRATESTTAHTFVNGSSVCTGFIHPNPQGANAIGMTLDTLLQTMVSSGSVFNQDATNAANLITNGGMTGTTGTCNTTGMSGTLATSWSASIDTNRGGTTAVCSQTTIDGTHTKNTLTITPGNTSTLYDIIHFRSANITTKLPLPGTCTQAFMHVTTGSNPPSRFRMFHILTPVIGNVQTAIGFNDMSGTFTYPGLANWSGWVHSDPVKVPAGGLSNMQLWMYGIGPNTGNSYAYSVDNAIVLNVTCPWITWGLPTATP